MRCCILSVLLFCCCNLHAQMTEDLKNLLLSYHEKAQFDGVVLVSDIDGIILQESYGWADIENGIPLRTDGSFSVGALEQVFTSLLAFRMAEEGVIRLDAPLSEVLPDFCGDTAKKIRIFHLLTHTSGLADYCTLPKFWNEELQNPQPSDYILGQICKEKLLFEPGSAYQFSHSNYFIIGKVIELISGRPLEWLLNSYLFSELGMMQSGLGVMPPTLLSPIKAYYTLGGTYLSSPSIFLPNLLGTASMYSNAYDLYIWERSLYGHPLLSQENMKEFLQPVYQLSEKIAVGYGWIFERHSISKTDSLTVMMAEGMVRGFRAGLYRIPDRGISIILLSNKGFYRQKDLMLDILRILHQQNTKPVALIPSEQWYQLFQARGMSGLLSELTAIKKKSGTLTVNIQHLEHLAERMLLKGHHQETDTLFQWMTAQFAEYDFGNFYSGKISVHLNEEEKGRSALKKISNPTSQAYRHAAAELSSVEGNANQEIRD
jgi:CubicO group peptidase (beta-lactamase class C family)